MVKESEKDREYMRKEKNYDFRQRLLQVHKPNIREMDRTARDNELFLTDGVDIWLEAEANDVIKTAAQDFIQFLSISMGISAKLLLAEEKGSGQIMTATLAKGSGRDLGDAAVYRGFMIETAPEGIRIYGHDPRGVAQAFFYLEDIMCLEKAPAIPYGTIKKRPLFSPQMVHSGYGVDEYPDEYLAAIAHEGRDAILVFTKGVNETPGGFLDFNDLISRAASYGIDVYAYSKLISNMSPEAPEAEDYYENTYGRLFRECPGLRGVTLVGESVEFPSRDPHVAKGRYFETAVDGIPNEKPSSGWYPCEDYSVWLNLIKNIIRKYNPEADIVFWTYNWGYQPEEARVKLIESLPTDISLQATFEMFESRHFGSATVQCADYTLSFAGPGQYFASEAKAAKKRGIRLYSMTNTGGVTWDFGAVPYEPMPYQWLRRYEAMRAAHDEWGLCGIMETHHYGFYPSFISKLSKWCFQEPREEMEAVLRRLIASEFGTDNFEATDKALQLWSEAIHHYTPTNADQYGAFRVGPSYPFSIDGSPKLPTDEKAMYGNCICMPDYYSKVDARNSLLSVRVYEEIKSLKKMIQLMEKGLSLLKGTENPNENLIRLYNLGVFIRNSIQTGIHAKEWYVLTCQLKAERRKDELSKILDEMESLLRREMVNVQDTIPVVEADSRLGWEPSMLYVTDRWHLEWKLRQVQHILDFEIKAYRESLEK